MGQGSGFFISPDGYAVTNNHVVEKADSVQITTDDGKIHKAKVIGTDPRTDLALIKVDGDSFPYVKLSDQQPRIGDWVLAVGNPFGLGGTVTVGIVSARNRDINSGPYDDFIQTDAAINRGNSGGPLINSHGEVIGINSAIYTPSGTTAGIGFAIPINTAKRIAQDLINEGRVHLAFIGVQTIPVGGDLAEALQLPVDDGLLVENAAKGGPAATAGIRGGDRIVQAGMQRIAIGGDVIVAIDGSKIANTMDLSVILNRKRPGDSVTVTVYRAGKKLDIPVKLGERTENQRQQ